MPRPTKPVVDRGALLRQGLVVVRLLTERERLRGDLQAELGCSARTVSRILHAVSDAGIRLDSRREGARVWYSITDTPRSPSPRNMSSLPRSPP